MDKNPENSEVTDRIDILDIAQVVADNLRLLIFGSLTAGVIALVISFAITPTFTARTTFIPPQQQQGAAASMLQTLGALNGIAGAVGGIKNPVDQYIALAGSRSVEDALIQRFKLQERYKVEFIQDARQLLEEATRIHGGKNGLITIDVDDNDPKFAAEMANAYIEELSNLMGRLAVTEAQQRRVFFENQLAKAKEGLSNAETSLKATGISASVIKANPEATVGAVAALMAQVTSKEVELGAMRNYLSDNAPQFKRAQSELAALKAQLVSAEKDGNRLSGNGDYISKFRDFKYYETLFELMAKQYEMARIDESREGATIQVVDVAIPPERKSRPKKAIIAILSTLVSGLFLLVFVFVRQALRNVRQDPVLSGRIEGIRVAVNQAFRNR